MSKDRLIYLPLGGAGEIGMNAYVYGYGPQGSERLILVDLGVTFPNMETTPGVDLIFPDVSWLEENADRLDAIIITHGHEDHIGAIGHLWHRLKAPIYARSFTSELIRGKMDDLGAPSDEVRTVSSFPETIKVGPFTLSFVPTAHSIPECSGLVIDTPAGRLFHTGDFKLDKTPIVGEPFDEDLWKEIAKPGVKAMICDSTNVFADTPGRSEESLADELRALVASANGMFVATTFASNVARLKTLAQAGVENGRSICLLGRAMRRMIEAAVKTGVLKNFPATVSPEDAAQIPRENLMLIVTGSQGERRAASAQLSRGKYLGLSMKEGDTFLFSSKTIPGNERGVISVINAFSEMGVDVIDDTSGRHHVSGHANRPDLVRVHNLIDPEVVIPMHGEHRHLREHVKLAKAGGRKAALAVNGTMLDLTGPVPEAVDFIETGRTYLDGSVKIGAMDGVVRDRIRMALNGHAIVTMVIDEDGDPLGDPWVELMGLPEIGSSAAPVIDVLEEDLSQLVGRMERKTLADDDKLEEALRRETRRSALNEIGRKPEVTVIVSRLS